MDIIGFDKVLVRNILEHATDYEWKMQDIGLLGLRLDNQWHYRLHVWSPDHAIGPNVIHDHPYDFVSKIIVGELTNIRYAEDGTGVTYVRDRYSPSNEERRTTDMVQLIGSSETYGEGDMYEQSAPELHESRQLPGTVTTLRMTLREVNELTTCRSEDAPRISGLSRPATTDEIKSITSIALNWF